MPKSFKKLLLTVAGLAAFAVGGAAIADASTSQGSKTTASTSTTAPTTTQAPAAAQAPPNMPAHGSAAHEDAEKAVTGTAAAQAKAAAVKAVGSGTAGDVTTDYSGTGYEVTVTKSDGSTVEVHLDSSFNAMQGPPGPGDPPPSA
jgi:hypothetical protein